MKKPKPKLTAEQRGIIKGLKMAERIAHRMYMSIDWPSGCGDCRDKIRARRKKLEAGK